MKVELITTLKRQASNILAKVNKSKQPLLITEHGMPSAYILDVETFERMQKRIQILEGIARGEKAILEGRVLSHQQATKKMKRWLS